MRPNIRQAALAGAFATAAALPAEALAGNVDCVTTTGDEERHIALEHRQTSEYVLLWRIHRGGRTTEGDLTSTLSCAFQEDDPGVIAICREHRLGRCVYVSRTPDTVRFRISRHMFGRCVGVAYEEAHERDRCTIDTSNP